MLHSDLGYACPDAPFWGVESLNTPIQYTSCGETEGVTLEDIVCDDRPGQEDIVYCHEVIALVKKAFLSLPRRLRKVAVLYYVKGQNQATIAANLGVTRSAICQMLASVNLRLRQAVVV